MSSVSLSVIVFGFLKDVFAVKIELRSLSCKFVPLCPYFCCIGVLVLFVVTEEFSRSRLEIRSQPILSGKAFFLLCDMLLVDFFDLSEMLLFCLSCFALEDLNQLAKVLVFIDQTSMGLFMVAGMFSDLNGFLLEIFLEVGARLICLLK